MPHDPKSTNRLARKKEATRQKIVDIAMNLFQKQGFESTTLEQISEEVDVAKKTIYNYFPNKEDIVIEYMQREMARTEAGVMHAFDQLPDTRSRLVAATFGYLQWIEKELNIEKLDKFYIYLLQKLIANRGARSDHDHPLCHIFKRGQEEGEIRPDISAGELANSLEWIHVSVVLAWANNREINARALYEKKVALFLEGAGCRDQV